MKTTVKKTIRTTFNLEEQLILRRILLNYLNVLAVIDERPKTDMEKNPVNIINNITKVLQQGNKQEQVQFIEQFTTQLNNASENI